MSLPINQAAAPVSMNQRDGVMTYHVDGRGENPHVNYEPSSTGGLSEAPRSGPDYEPQIEGRLVRAKLSRTNLVTMLGDCERQIQERMVGHLTQCDSDYGRRVAEGLGLSDATSGNGASGDGRFASGARETAEPARP